ncbi:hypothetical protein AAFF_G00114820 [Aldrovandia affinis]|uniref:Uncharacterized protein n=1 Tax=Aldrovandia affinis TaxID=143900 RepID=A0AAD7RSV4_9TELE|nr:hypothetical protein AAFF_G00114820 [Aldrovandia affinis]
MGCTTSVVLFEGLRTVIQRNCGYVCKSSAELAAAAAEERAPNMTQSLTWHSASASICRTCARSMSSPALPRPGQPQVLL